MQSRLHHREGGTQAISHIEHPAQNSKELRQKSIQSVADELLNTKNKFLQEERVINQEIERILPHPRIELQNCKGHHLRPLNFEM